MKEGERTINDKYAVITQASIKVVAKSARMIKAMLQATNRDEKGCNDHLLRAHLTLKGKKELALEVVLNKIAEYTAHDIN